MVDGSLVINLIIILERPELYTRFADTIGELTFKNGDMVWCTPEIDGWCSVVGLHYLAGLLEMSSGIYQAAQVDSEMKRNETLQGVKDVPRKQQLHFFLLNFVFSENLMFVHFSIFKHSHK